MVQHFQDQGPPQVRDGRAGGSERTCREQHEGAGAAGDHGAPEDGLVHLTAVIAKNAKKLVERCLIT